MANERMDDISEGSRMNAANGNMGRRFTTENMIDGGKRMARGEVRMHERREHKAKSQYYRMKHRQAKDEFRRIGGTSVESEEQAVAVLRQKLKSGTYDEVARLIFAAAHLCWACDERGEERFVEEEAHGNADADGDEDEEQEY